MAKIGLCLIKIITKLSLKRPISLLPLIESNYYAPSNKRRGECINMLDNTSDTDYDIIRRLKLCMKFGKKIRSLLAKKPPPELIAHSDFGILSAKELSKGSEKKKIWDNLDKSAPSSWGPGGMVEVEIPFAYALIEKGGKESRIRGWGIGGQWRDTRDCKRCNNSGHDASAYELPCTYCQGASYKPKI